MLLFSLVLFLLIHFPLNTQQKPLKEERNFNSLDSSSKSNQIKSNTTSGNLTNTFHKLNHPRCQGPKEVSAENSRTWGKNILSYQLQNVSENVPKNKAKSVLKKAINQWTNQVDIKIIETEQNPDVRIYFSEIDGPHSIIGYAFYPENGEIYFDSSEDWEVDAIEDSKRIYFSWAATHELGHSLGLIHSNDERSVMYKYYDETVLGPTKEDISKLQLLYGQRKLNNTDLCSNLSVDAILEHERSLLVRGNKYWILANETVDYGPFFLNELFSYIPEKIDASFKIGNISYIFSDDVFYKYNQNYEFLAQKLIGAGFEGVPSGIQAAFYYKQDAIIYFFKGSKFYAFNVRKPVNKRLVIDGKEIRTHWNDLPGNIEAATLVDNSRVLFIKSATCYFYSFKTNTLLNVEPCSSYYRC